MNKQTNPSPVSIQELCRLEILLLAGQRLEDARILAASLALVFVDAPLSSSEAFQQRAKLLAAMVEEVGLSRPLDAARVLLSLCVKR